MLPPVINRKVAFLMASLCVYGILLIFIANKNISPYAYIMNTIYYPDASPTSITVNESEAISAGSLLDIPPTRLLNNNLYTSVDRDANVVDSVNSMNSSAFKLENSSSAALELPPSALPSSSSTESTRTSTTVASTDHTKEQLVLTMFTTFKNSATKEHIYKNTIHNWALLQPYVKPVMYVIPGEIDLAEYGQELGWDSHNVPKSSKQGVPILRHMFLHAQARYNSTFYAYANGDILFTQDLIDTLRAIIPYKDKVKRMMLVGRRTNCQMKPGQEIRSLEEVAAIMKKGKEFNSNAQDYFISTLNGYPWDTIPDFVVGRVGYDNWLVVTALTKGMAVFDLSKTVSAMHQTGTDGNMAGHSKKPRGDTYVNYGLAGSKFDYSLGHVTCSQFYSTRSGQTISIAERKQNGCVKLFKKYRKNPYLKLPSR